MCIRIAIEKCVYMLLHDKGYDDVDLILVINTRLAKIATIIDV